jgi:Signal transduction histidine kinase
LPADKIFYKIIITDNGIGFDDQYAKKIFQPFYHLHGKSDYEGNGFGLSICKKIMEKHNGIISASGKENTGASFTIILPEKHN